MKIECIYIACYRHDIHFTRILVASIRRWHCDVPIFLIKDRFYGEFSTVEIERAWNVGVFSCDRKLFNWGFGKLEPLFLPERKRCLILDSDIVFAGPVLQRLEQFGEDFVVQEEKAPLESFILSNYFDLSAVRALDPQYRFPGFTFNTGQLVATTGILKRSDFDACVVWSEPPSIRLPDIFKYGEQGLLNYLLVKKSQQGSLSLRPLPFMQVGNNPDVLGLEIARLNGAVPYDFLIHWCGLRQANLREMPRADILMHFEAAYYRHVPMGAWKRLARRNCRFAGYYLQVFLRRFPALHRCAKSIKTKLRAAHSS